MDEQTKHDDADRQEQLPAHESDADVSKTMGAGVMNEGGTAVDRGTGELSGTAQGEHAGEEGDDDEAFGAALPPNWSGQVGMAGSPVPPMEDGDRG